MEVTLPEGVGGRQLVKCILMETVRDPVTLRPPGIRELPIVAGNLALDFANTVDDPDGPERFDHIAVYPGLLAWATRVGLTSPATVEELARVAAAEPARADVVVQQASELRAALNETFPALLDGRSADAGWDRLRPFVVRAVQASRLDPGREHRTSWDESQLEFVLWPVSDAAHRLLTSPELRRLKQCANCPWLFLDQSKNGSRRWCSMQFCGTEQKVRRYVSKRAERRSGAGAR
jgi:predicted RNA-binding Zn ribbon-like protein